MSEPRARRPLHSSDFASSPPSRFRAARELVVAAVPISPPSSACAAALWSAVRPPGRCRWASCRCFRRLVLDDAVLSRKRPLLPWLLLMLGFGAGGFVLHYYRRYLAARTSLDLQHELRVAIQRRLHLLDFSRHDQLSTGDHHGAGRGRRDARTTVREPGARAGRERDLAAGSFGGDAEPVAAAITGDRRCLCRRSSCCRSASAIRLFPASFCDQRLSGRTGRRGRGGRFGLCAWSRRSAKRSRRFRCFWPGHATCFVRACARRA